jgi:N-acetylneuraminate synthase/N,N'-diacetyllegionaminate synthase
MSSQIEIGGRLVGEDAPPMIIAEAGVNHDGSPEQARRLVEAAGQAGADAVKFQTFHADAIATADAGQVAYQRARSPSATQRDMLRALELPDAAWQPLAEEAAARGLIFLSTPFDARSAVLLADLGVAAFKVGSGDLTNLVLLRRLAGYGRPLLVSTGMATMDEVDAAVADLRAHGDPPLVLLHCTSAYPAPLSDANLRAMVAMRRRYGVPIGYSDHTLGIGAALAAAALGAAVIEKHLTLDRAAPGPDHAASLEPDEFAAMVRGVRETVAALGSGRKQPTAAELETRQLVRRALVLTRAVPAGEPLGVDDLDALRPADGISPLRLDEVAGRRAARDLQAGRPLSAEDLDPPLDG